MAEQFKSPHIELGDIVLWYPDAVRRTEETAHVGIVTKLGIDSVNLNVFSPANHNLMLRDGVRHIEDPKATHPDLRSQGAWEHTLATKRRKAMELKVMQMFEFLAKEGNKQFADALVKDNAERERRKAQLAERERETVARG